MQLHAVAAADGAGRRRREGDRHVNPAGCLGPWKPKYGVACLNIQGGAGQCTQSRGPETAQVFFEPYQPGATYVASGRGCGAIFDFTTDPTCQTVGPINATL